MENRDKKQYKIIACDVMSRELVFAADRAGINIDIQTVDLGLHLTPEKLGKKLQEIIDSNLGWERLVLAFGLCGGGTKGLMARDSIITLPRCHDCIPILLGSLNTYKKIQKQEPGTYYLCRGFVQGGQGLLQEYEDWHRRFGEKKAKRIQKAMYANYRRLLLVGTNLGIEREVRDNAVKSAELLSLEYEEIAGTEEIMEKILLGPWDDEKLFINIPPGEVIREEHFGI